MRYRVAAVPASFVAYDSFIVEDQQGRQYLFEHGQLSVLAPDDLALTLTVFELSQSFDWHAEDELPRLLGELHGDCRCHVARPSRSSSAASAAA